MKKRKLNYRFHDPNPADMTAAYILKVFVEANAGKVEKAIQAAADSLPDTESKPTHIEDRPA